MDSIPELLLLGLHFVEDDELDLDLIELEGKAYLAHVAGGVVHRLLDGLLDVGENLHQLILRIYGDLDRVVNLQGHFPLVTVQQLLGHLYRQVHLEGKVVAETVEADIVMMVEEHLRVYDGHDVHRWRLDAI